MTKERERMAKRQQALYGSRIERADRPEEEEYRDEINVFVDSEYTIEGVVREVISLVKSFREEAEEVIEEAKEEVVADSSDSSEEA